MSDDPCAGFPRQAMLLLVSLHHGAAVDAVDGRLAIRLDGGWSDVSTLDDALAECEARGWVELTPGGVRATERGGYWLKRWLRSPAVRAEVRKLPRRAC